MSGNSNNQQGRRRSRRKSQPQQLTRLQVIWRHPAFNWVRYIGRKVRVLGVDILGVDRTFFMIIFGLGVTFAFFRHLRNYYAAYIPDTIPHYAPQNRPLMMVDIPDIGL